MFKTDAKEFRAFKKNSKNQRISGQQKLSSSKSEKSIILFELTPSRQNTNEDMRSKSKAVKDSHIQKPRVSYVAPFIKVSKLASPLLFRTFMESTEIAKTHFRK